MSNKEENLEVIKVIPWMGPNEEIFDGKKTKIVLYKDRLEYKLFFKQKVIVEDIEDGDRVNSRSSIGYCDEEGFILKDSIHHLSKYVENDFSDEIPNKINMIDITYNSGIMTFSTSTEEEKNNLYKKIYNWKFNIIE